MKNSIATAAMSLVCIAAGAQAPPEPFQSAFESGNSLLSRALNRSTNEADFGKALFFVRGVSDATSGTTHCAPESVTNGQILAMSIKLLEEWPEQRHRAAASYVIHAMREAFPCPSSQKPITKTY